MQSKLTLQQQQLQRGSVQPKPGRGRKRTCGVIPNHIYTDYELGWKEQSRKIQKPVFSGVPRNNKNFHITQDSSPWDIYAIFFSPEMFKLIQKETN
jgi:hypothetical protein